MDRQSGALELLLATPITVPEIVRGQRLALERQFALPMFVVLLVDFVFLMSMRRESEAVFWMGTFMVIFVVDMLALCWVGMWRGLNSRRANRAAAATIVRIMLLPWVAWLVIVILIGVSSIGRGGGGAPWWDGHFLPLLILALSIGTNVIFGLPARTLLLSQFRAVATTRFETHAKK